MIPYFWYLLALAICGLAFWKGDRSVKLAGLAVLASWTLSPLVGHATPRGWNFAVMVVDTNMVIALTWVSLRYRTLWSAVLVAFGILVVLNPIVFMFDRALHTNAFRGANNIVTVCQLMTLLPAVWLSPARRRDEGVSS